MERDELVKQINSVTDVSKDRKIIYYVLTELGIPFTRTNCRRCLYDLYSICREELGLINDASQLSLFNDVEDEDVQDEPLEEKVMKRWHYIATRPASWNGYIVSDETDYSVLEKFCESHPSYCKQV